MNLPFDASHPSNVSMDISKDDFEFPMLLDEAPAGPLGPPRPNPSGITLERAVEGLLQLRGLWTAEYGSHGPEVVHLRGIRNKHSGDMDESSEVNFVEGFKVIGDVNVPAGEVSFAVDLRRFALGRFDGVSLHTGDTFEGPIVSFNGHGVIAEDLEGRRIAARFAGLGTTNSYPGTWRPEFESVELLLYETDEGQIDLTMFSVMWTSDRTWDLADFTPYRLPYPPSFGGRPSHLRQT
eukprot:gene20456-27245_t